MKGAIEIAKITFKQAIKERSFYVILVTTLLAIMAIPVLYGFTMFEIPRILAGFALSYANFAVLVLMLLLSMGLSQVDLERKTLQYVLSLPIRRRDYIFGRFLGFMLFALLMICGILILLYPPVILVSRLRPDAPFYPHLYFLYGLFLFTEIAILVAFALLFVALTYRAMVSTFGVLGVYIVGHTLDEVAQFLKTKKGAEMPLFSKLIISGVKYLLPNLSLFDVKTDFIYGHISNSLWLILSILYGIVYATLILLLAILFFERKEIF